MDYNWFVNKKITTQRVEGGMFLSLKFYWLGEKQETKTKEVVKERYFGWQR